MTTKVRGELLNVTQGHSSGRYASESKETVGNVFLVF